ncbi:MAG TPA: GDSL-type esterase/lipase family protein, partial [Verrucomicrobiae bacterium]
MMQRISFRSLLLRLAAVGWLAWVGGVTSSFAAVETWVATWGCSPQLVEPHNLPPVALSGKLLRQFIHTSVAGDRVQVRFSNRYGQAPLAIQAAHLARANGAGSGQGEIDPATDAALTFQGQTSVVLAPGTERDSDPLTFALPPLASLAVTIQLGEVSTNILTGHPGSRTTSYMATGSARDLAAPKLSASTNTAHWYFLTGLQVQAAVPGARCVAILGDSITDGRGSTTDGNNRWPDVLAARLQTNAATAGVGVVNLGIGGNGFYGGLGPAALKRFEHDVLEQPGVRYVILFEGVNDIGGGRDTAAVTNALVQLARQAHARQLPVWAATITPFQGNQYYTPAHEAVRVAVNEWLRHRAPVDAVLDFDATVR